MPTELPRQIQDFIVLVDVYVDKGTRYARAEKVACRMARQGKEAHALNDAIPALLDQFKKSRQAVLTAAMPLAKALEQAGASSRNVLALHNAVESKGGSASIRKLWPRLKAELQQFAIKDATPKARKKRRIKAGRKPDPDVEKRDNSWLKDFEAGQKSGVYETLADFARSVEEEPDTVRKGLKRARDRRNLR